MTSENSNDSDKAPRITNELISLQFLPTAYFLLSLYTIFPFPRRSNRRLLS